TVFTWRSTSELIWVGSALSVKVMVTVEKPSPETLVVLSILFRLATASSMGRVIWVSIACGFAPAYVVVTVTTGMLTCGNSLIGSATYAEIPAIARAAKIATVAQ